MKSKVARTRLLFSTLAAFSLFPFAFSLDAQPAELKWAGDPEGGAPFVEADPADPNKVTGFDVEIAELIAKGVSKEQFVAQLKLDDLGWTLNPNAVAYRSLPRLYDELSKS